MALPSFEIHSYPQDDLIIQEGQMARGLFLIRKGRVEVFRGSGPSKVVLGVATRGQFLGEMSILLGRECSASARALDDVEVALFQRSLCETQLKSSPTWLVSLAQGLAHRLDLTNSKLQLLGKSQQEQDYVATSLVGSNWEGSDEDPL